MIREIKQSENLNMPKKTKQQKGGNSDGGKVGMGIDASSKKVHPYPILVRGMVRSRDFIFM